MSQRNSLTTNGLPQFPGAFASSAGASAFANVAEPSARVAAPPCRARRATRIAASLPISLRDQFGATEETRTQFLTVRGAVLATNTNARVGCKLTIQNLKNGKTAECHVVGLESMLKGIHQVEVEFTRPQPGFWPVQFPADDASANEVKDTSLKTALPTATTDAKMQSVTHELLLEVDTPKSTFADLELESSSKHESHDDQLVSLADSITQSFNSASSMRNSASFSSKTGSIDSVAQFRAANRAAHRREQQTKVFYSFLSLAMLAGAIFGVRSWTQNQAGKQHVTVAAVAQPPAPITSSQPEGAAVDVPPTSAVAATVPSTSESSPLSEPDKNASPAEAVAAPAPADIKPQETEVAVRHGALSASARKPVQEQEEAPLAMPLRAASDAAQVKPELLNSVVSNFSTKNPVLAPQAPKKVVPARLLHSVPAQYPALARQMQLEGNVILEVEIDAAGNVSKAIAVSGAPLLRAAAIGAVKQWKYQPATLGDKAVSSSETIKVNFHAH